MKRRDEFRSRAYCSLWPTFRGPARRDAMAALSPQLDRRERNNEVIAGVAGGRRAAKGPRDTHPGADMEAARRLLPSSQAVAARILAQKGECHVRDKGPQAGPTCAPPHGPNKPGADRQDQSDRRETTNEDAHGQHPRLTNSRRSANNASRFEGIQGTFACLWLYKAGAADSCADRSKRIAFDKYDPATGLCDGR